MRSIPALQATCQRGGAVVEFALVLVLLITLMAGIFEFGRAFWYYDALTKATRDGARVMSVSDKATIASAGVTAATTLVVNAVLDAGVPDFDSSNVVITCLDATYADTGCADNTAPGGIRVQITGYTLSIGQFVPFLLGGSSSYTADLTPSTTMRYMQ